MKLRNLSHKSTAFVLLVSMLLQSCGVEVPMEEIGKDLIIISEAKLQVVLKAYYQHPDFKSVPSFLGEAPMSVESIECHLELHEQKKVEEKKEGQDQFAQREERLEWMTTPIELKDLFKNRSLKPNEPEKEINTVLDTCVDVNQEAVQEEKTELFFDEFIDLLRKYNEAGTEKLDLIKADLEALCDRYGKYGTDPLGKKYTWGDDTYTPLQFAARQGNQAVIEVLCSEGYRARAFIYAKTDICGSTALHLATEGGHNHIVKHLLSLDQGLANAQDKEGQSALHYATYGKHVNLATYLVNDVKADLDILDSNGLSVLHVAVYVQSVELVDLFLKNMTRETIQMQDIKGNKAIDYVNAQTAPEIQECFASYQTDLQRELSVIDTRPCPQPLDC